MVFVIDLVLVQKHIRIIRKITEVKLKEMFYLTMHSTQVILFIILWH